MIEELAGCINRFRYRDAVLAVYQLKVFKPVAWRIMHQPGALLAGHMIAGKQGHCLVIAFGIKRVSALDLLAERRSAQPCPLGYFGRLPDGLC